MARGSDDAKERPIFGRTGLFWKAKKQPTLLFFFLVLRLLLLAVGTVPRSTDFATIHFTTTISMTYIHNFFFNFIYERVYEPIKFSNYYDKLDESLLKLFNLFI